MRRVPSSAVRLVAAVAVGAALAFGVSGCALAATQATQIQYSPSDGINVPGTGPLDVRNAFIVANEDGSAANFVAAVVNTTGDRQTLNYSIGADGERFTLAVPANSTVSLGVDGVEPAALGDIATPPGATLDMYFQAGDAEGVVVGVPVLDASLDYLEPLAPES